MKQIDYERLFSDILNDVIDAYYKWDALDKYTLTIIGEDILYLYAYVRLGYDSDKALDFSVKYFKQKLEEYKNE